MTMCDISPLIVFISILTAMISKFLITLSNDDRDDGDDDEIIVLLVERRVLFFWMNIVSCLLSLMILGCAFTKEWELEVVRTIFDIMNDSNVD